MRIEDFPEDIKPHLIPEPSGKMIYRCLSCDSEFGIEKLLYTCPDCGHVLMLHDENATRLKEISGETWRRIFDCRKMLNTPGLKGIYRYQEFIGPNMPVEDVVYLGEGHTPVIEAGEILKEKIGITFHYKNDGQNPSASFKDRGMASALSYINHLIRQGLVSDVLSICASTGDTSAAAALYASYLAPHVKSAVLLPHGKVTPQQLSQPLGSGASVFEIPGVFDDCMKVVEHLSDHYNVALLNSKNAWRILGQESFSYEIAQDFEYDLKGKVVIVPIGNAGNITAVMNGFLKFYDAGIIEDLPKIIGVQSEHANPVYKYYLEEDAAKRVFKPVKVTPSVAQAAMIGNPVSMPRVISVADRYNALSGKQNVFVVEVTEQEIMDSYLTANRNGHIACTQGGETLAGLVRALDSGIVSRDEEAVLDSTAHAMKFSDFQTGYFSGDLDPEFGVKPKEELVNMPELIREKHPESQAGEAFKSFVENVSAKIAGKLELKNKQS